MQRNDQGLICKQDTKEQQQQQQQLQVQYNQQLRPLSLGDISPVWARRLNEKQSPMFAVSPTRLRWLFEIIHPRKCVVAEAYGFSLSYAYNCAVCAKTGNKFSLYFSIYFPKKHEENQKRFVKHLYEKHLKA
jgi:hypothetical protein